MSVFAWYRLGGDGWQATPRFLVLTTAPGMFWVRVRVPWPGTAVGRLGPGVKILDTRKGRVPFSVRSRIQTFAFRVGPFVVCGIGWSPR